MSADFQTAVRSLQLPTARGLESELQGRLDALIAAMGIQREDRAAWLFGELAAWREGGQPSTLFTRTIKEALFQPTAERPSLAFPNLVDPEHVGVIGRNLADGYFDLHERLVSKHFLTFEQARQLLSYSGVISRLALLDFMSASEITRWLTAADARLPWEWRAVQAVLRTCGQVPELSQANVEATFAEDEAAEFELFGDQTQAEAIDQVGQIASTLGVERFGAEEIQTLISGHQPYLPILHYQLLIQNSFDHALSYLYEFSPRGELGKWILNVYTSAGFEVAGSAVLNNTKSVDRIDAGWAAPKKSSQRKGAKALSSILLGLEELGTSAKSELSLIIRRLLCRLIRTRREQGQKLKHELFPIESNRISSFLRTIAAANTQTYGILEQRALEALIAADNPSGSFFGVGDSVFATNTHRKKLGDFELRRFAPEAPAIDAYEAHGGHLTRAYVEDHLRTFSKVLAQRVEDIETIAPLANWTIRVVFVSHGFESGLASVRSVPVGKDKIAKVQIVTEKYIDVVGRVKVDLTDCWNERVTSRMNLPEVPARFRERTLLLMAQSAED